MSYIYTEMTQVVGIIRPETQGLAYMLNSLVAYTPAA